MSDKSGAFVVGGAVLAVGAVFLGFSCVEVVSPGYRGVVTRLGTVSMTPMSEGLNMKSPLDSVEEWCVQVQKIEATCNAGSADLQTVHTQISINYRLNADLTPAIRKDFGASYEDNIIKPALQESVKAVIARYQAAQLLEKRAAVRHEMELELSKKLGALLENGFLISALNIENFSFEASFNAAIEAKQVAEQEAQRTRNEVEREKAEADKQIEAARGRAESRALEAKAQAGAILVEAEARAKAIQLESAALRDNPDILRLRAIERWDGGMPRVVGGDGGNFLFSLDMSAPSKSSSIMPGKAEKLSGQ